MDFLKRIAKIVRRPTPVLPEHDLLTEDELPHAPTTDYIEFRISALTVLKVSLIVVGVVLIFQILGIIADVLLFFFVAAIIAAAMMPTVDRMERRGWPRAVTTTLLFLVVIGVMLLIITNLIPILAEQVTDLARNISGVVEKVLVEGPGFLPVIGPRLGRIFADVDPTTVANELRAPLQDLGKTLFSFTGNAVGAAGQFLVGLLDTAAIIIMSFYMVVRKSSLEGFLRDVTPRRYVPYVIAKYRLVFERLGIWLRAQLLVMLIIFASSFIGFSAIQIPYALFLSLLAGVLSVVPVIGWITAGFLAILIALTQSGWMLIGALVVVLLVHFVDGYVVVPLITEKAVGVNPVSVILVLLIGFKLAGLLGVLIAVPIATVAIVFLQDLRHEPAPRAKS